MVSSIRKYQNVFNCTEELQRIIIAAAKTLKTTFDLINIEK